MTTGAAKTQSTRRNLRDGSPADRPGVATGGAFAIPVGDRVMPPPENLRGAHPGYQSSHSYSYLSIELPRSPRRRQVTVPERYPS